MIKYTVANISDIDITPIVELEGQFTSSESEKPDIMRVLKSLKRLGGRVVLAHDGDEFIGHYVYVPFNKWTMISPKLFAVKAEMLAHNIDLDECTMPLYVHLKTEYNSKENYLEFNKYRIEDAVKNGFKYGVVGINRGNPTYCYQQTWIDLKDEFEEYTNTEIIPLTTKYEGETVYIQYY